MAKFEAEQIGMIRVDENGFQVVLEPKYRPAMKGLEGFSHLNVLWWFHRAARGRLTEEKPYVKGPEELGVFATRSPERPSALALSCVQVTWLDPEAGVIGLAWLDAEDGSPVLDLKPYTPGLDRVEAPGVPAWCAHWPRSVEESGSFDWAAEFNF